MLKKTIADCAYLALGITLFAAGTPFVFAGYAREKFWDLVEIVAFH